MNKAPVSFCLIVKNEPLLEKCLLSIRDYVEEIVIVDTGSTDGVTQEIAKKYADIFEIYTDCNDPDTGLINDFSQGRQRAFDLATKQWVGWLDADDIIVGAENLNKIIEEFNQNKKDLDGVGFLFPYEYSYDENGECTCRHYRERLFFNKQNFHWINPVHEVCVPNDNAKIVMIPKEDLIFKHRRQYSTKVPEQGRNLRIMRRHFEKMGESDARQLYYLGLECCNAGLIDESIKHLSRYIEVSGWDDERVMACLKLVDIYQGLAQYTEGLKWSFKAIEIIENWAEGYLAAGRMFYFLASNGEPNERRNWEKCIYFIRMGLKFPPTQTLLFINPSERKVEIHKYLNLALNKIGDVKGALESANLGLANKPTETTLLTNKKLYEVFLARQDAVVASNKLRDIGEITQKSVEMIAALLNNKPLNISFELSELKKHIEGKWNVPNTWDFDSLPIEMTNEQLQASVIMMWKQFMLHDEAAQAISFLENAPLEVRNSKDTLQALSITKEFANRNSTLDLVVDPLKIPIIIKENPLDIIFFAGEGIEIWTPNTVKKTGIGGSELMLLEQAKRLATLGHNVKVFSSCGLANTYDGVKYYPTKDFHNLNCDILVVSRRADMLSDEYKVNAKVKLLWVHDVCAINATNRLLLKANRILALSNWHKQNLINTHNLHPDHIIVTRNGIDLNRFKNKVSRNKFKVVNSSSPDRSWPILLEVWGDIKKQVPQAELHLFYGFKNWEASAPSFPGQMDLINSLKNKINELKSQGVVYHDRVNQEKLAEEFLSAGVWAYPTWFTETSCITAMEAQAAGLGIVTSSIAALNETVANRGTLIDGDWTTKPYKDKFVECVVNAMNNNNSDRIKLQQYAKEHFDLDKLAEDWEKMFYSLIDEVKKNPIVPYYPTTPYRGNGRGYYNGDTRNRV